MLRKFYLTLILASASLALPAQISISPAQVVFSVQISGVGDSAGVTITNNSARPFVATDVDLYHGDAFWVTDTAFTIPPSGSHTIQVYCDPRHNIRYLDQLLVKSPSHAEGISSLIFCQGKYANPYYDATQNLWHEDLKTALKSLITFGYTDLGYTNARDQIFINIDNKKNNGQGAAQNTIECIYTGTQAVGYINRQDCQTNYNFNTEHTFPQSLFGAVPPMVSDMHHLFGVTSSANSERSNNPYGVVTNPSWTNGGSKSNGSTFEPRDAHKGKAACAMFYFVLRYQNYSGFATSQEPILRQWAAQFPPDSIDRRRNDDIFALQNNRNPFCDHPFLERISSITGTAVFDSTPQAWYLTDTMNFGDAYVNVPAYGQFMISAQGLSDLNISNISFSDPAWSLAGNPSLGIPEDSVRKLWVKFAPTTPNSAFSGTMTLNTDDPNHGTITVALIGNSLTVGLEEGLAGISVFPNPVKAGFASKLVHIDRGSYTGESLHLQLFGPDGRRIREVEWQESSSWMALDLAGLPSGVYLLQVDDGKSRAVKKIVLE